MVDPLLALAILACATVASCIQSLSGFGFSLFIVPVLAVLIGPKETVFLANILSVASNTLQYRHLRQHIEWPLGRLLLIGSCIGMPFGVAVLVVIDPASLKLAIAVIVVVVTLLLMRGLRTHGGGRLGDLLAGFISGILNTSTSMSGPPIVIYLQGRETPPDPFRATATLVFGVSSAIAVALLTLGGASTREAWIGAAIALPGVAVGRLFGNAWYRRVDARLFRRIVYGVLLFSATVAVATTLLG